jgi:hypothetical protein
MSQQPLQSGSGCGEPAETTTSSDTGFSIGMNVPTVPGVYCVQVTTNSVPIDWLLDEYSPVSDEFCGVTVDPAGGTTTTPVVSGSNKIWWMGASSVNDNCRAGDGAQCYYNHGSLDVSMSPNRTAPPAGSTTSWSLTDPATGQPPTFATYNCATSDCSYINITATATPTGCGLVNVLVTVNGVSSNQYVFEVDWGRNVNLVSFLDQGDAQGYLSTLRLQLVSACGSPMDYIDVHEEFPAAWQSCGGNVSAWWLGPISQKRTDPNDPATGWSYQTTASDGSLSDLIAESCFPVGVQCEIPNPARPPANGNLSSQAVSWASWLTVVGSQDTTVLGKYVAALPMKQVRYLDHGRDQTADWACPVQ